MVTTRKSLEANQCKYMRVKPTTEPTTMVMRAASMQCSFQWRAELLTFNGGLLLGGEVQSTYDVSCPSL